LPFSIFAALAVAVTLIVPALVIDVGIFTLTSRASSALLTSPNGQPAVDLAHAVMTVPAVTLTHTWTLSAGVWESPPFAWTSTVPVTVLPA